MAAFFGVIGLMAVIFGVILFIVGIFSKKIRKSHGAILAALGLVLFIISVSTDINAEQKEKEKLSSMTVTERIEYNIKKKLGEKTNFDKNRVVSIEEKNGYVQVVLNADEGTDEKGTVLGILADAKEVFPIVFKENGVEKALVTFRLTFVDQYGKEKDDDAIIIVLTKPTSEKIEWRNFEEENFANVADSFYIHPGLND